MKGWSDMKKSFKYVEPSCSSCDGYKSLNYSTGRCEGGKKPRYFKKSDPKYKAPKWCPRRHVTPIVRVYGFVDDNARRMYAMHQSSGSQISPLAHHYKLVFETYGFLNAGDFYKRASREPVEQMIECDFEYGYIVEIDDGLRPYFFHYKSCAEVENVFFSPPKSSETTGMSCERNTRKGELL